MGQAHSHFERPVWFWHRNKSKAARREPTQESSLQPPAAGHSSAQLNQSSTTVSTTAASADPDCDIHGDAMADPNAKVGKADNVDKVEEQTNSPRDPTTASHPEKSDKSTEAAEASSSGRPSIRREHTPPHRVRILTKKAWQIEHSYSNVHDHVTNQLSRIRKQQTDSDRKSASARKIELDVYKAADSCTLALEYLVGNFSTKFFHHAGPENIMGMMATIDADATALDDLRWKQLQISSYGRDLEKMIAQTEGHIRELAELAKRIRDEDVHEDENREADADADTGPDVEAKKENANVISDQV